MCVTRFPLSRIKVVAVLILALVCVNVSLAEKVDADAAHRLASEFFSGPASRSVGKLSLAYTCPEDAAYYVFNAEAAEGGFVVVAGDDAVTPILGYSDVATFDPSNIPPALQWKLDSYKAEIAAAASKGIKVVGSRSASPDKAPIAPLITTQWGQGEPYNKFCPYDGDELSLTGCVATALAQIVNYHQWPNRGIGSFSYKWKDEELSFDYSTTSFDWDNMRDQYDGVMFSDQEANAVAELMYACGVGTEMSYSQFMSGSSESHAKRLLVENLNYSPEIAVRYIGNYSNDEWNDLLYKELADRRPMLCAGGGHAYICDGYDGDGYFHYNWGWEGFADGFFLPSLLNPIDDSAYQKGQTILIGIEPNWSGEVYHVPDLICKDEFKVDKFGRALIKVWNYSKYVFNGRVGAKIVSETGDSDVYHTFDWDINLEGVEMIGIFASTCGDHKNIQLPKDIGLASGQYKLYLSYQGEDSIWRDLRCFTGCQDHILLEVTKDNEYIYSNPPLPDVPAYNFTISDVKINDDSQKHGLAYAGNWIGITFTCTNLQDNMCRPNIQLTFVKDECPYNVFYECVELYGDGDKILGVTVPHEFEAGEYELLFYDDYGRRLNEEAVRFIVLPAVEPDLTLMDFSVKCESWDQVEFSMTVYNNTEAYYDKIFKAVFSNDDGDEFSMKFYSFITENSESTSPIFVNRSEYTFIPGEKYTVCVYDCHDKMIHDAPIRFTFPGGDGSGIEAPEVDGWDADAPVEYYDLQGRKVANPTTGFYIARQGALTRKVFIR